MRRIVAYLLVAPLALLGEYVAHQASYLSVHGSDAHHQLEESGHGYLSQAPLAISLLLGLMAFFVLVDAARVGAGRRPVDLPVWPLAFLGPIAFMLQEHLERWLHDGQFPWSAMLEPTFALGLGLQLPTALLAYVVARLVVGVARRAAIHVRSRLRRLRSVPCHLTRPLVERIRYVGLVCRDVAVDHVQGRAPPLLIQP